MTQGGLFQSEMEILFQSDLQCTPDTVSLSAVICRERSPGGMVLVVFGDDATIQRDTPGTVCLDSCWPLLGNDFSPSQMHLRLSKDTAEC